jgi:hypothetical protein
MKATISPATAGLALCLLLSLSACAAGQARAHGPSINERQYEQERRIAEGVRSGELTREEAETLRLEQRRIRAEERAYRADGVLSAAEWRELQRELNEADQNIHEEKHDRERRY